MINRLMFKCRWQIWSASRSAWSNFIACQQNCRKVMFSDVSVWERRSPCDQYDALDLTIQVLLRTSAPFQIWGDGACCQVLTQVSLLVTYVGHHWRPVQACPLDLTVQASHWHWHLLATKAHTVGKWALRILLGYFLIYKMYLCEITKYYALNQINERFRKPLSTYWFLIKYISG